MEDELAAIEIEATEMADAELTCMDAKLYDAAFEGDIDAFQQGVEKLLTPNENTVLHIHFTAETVKVSENFVKYIINLCPSIVLQANAKRETPLHIAARYGHSAAVEILMEHSRNIHEDLESGVGADKKLIRETNIVGDSALHEAVRYNHIQVVKLLIKEDPDYPYFANDDGETPLYLAGERGYKDIVFEILENSKSAAYGGPDGRTALHAVAIDRDKDVGIKMAEHVSKKERLMSSINETDKQEMVEDSLEKERLMSSIKPDKQGRLDYNLTKLLLEHNRNPADKRDNEGHTALHLAVLHHNYSLTMKLLEHNRNSAYVRDNEGRTALHLAVLLNYYSFTKLLLEHNRNSAYMRDNEGRTALHLAARDGFSSTMEMILSHCPDSAEIVDNNGQNALHFAVSRYDGISLAESVRLRFSKVNRLPEDDRLSKVQLIMEKLSLSNLYNEKDVDGNTPLHLSSLKGGPSLILELIEHPRVDKLAFNKENCTAYDIVSKRRFGISTTNDPYSRSQYEKFLKIRDSLEEDGTRMRCHRIRTPKTTMEYEKCIKDSGNINKNDEDDEDEDEDKHSFMTRGSKKHIVAAALITTVTFAAGFTLPGGTIQEGKHQGTAILKHNPSFQAFIVTDTIAMVLSAMAVVLHLLMSVTTGSSTRYNFLIAAFYLTLTAMASMIIAFVTGTYAVLGISSGLGVVILLIGISFLIPCFFSLKHALDH